MEKENTVEQKDRNFHKNKVHQILAHSYLFYFLSFLIALFLDFIFPMEIFEKITMTSIGTVFLIIGTVLIIWAQKSSLKLRKESITKETFLSGPYRYTRSPTHYGLFFLMLGFGIMANALFIIILSIFSFFVTKFIFIKKEEQILGEKYGTPYLEYKKLVKF